LNISQRFYIFQAYCEFSKNQFSKLVVILENNNDLVVKIKIVKITINKRHNPHFPTKYLIFLENKV